jgi:hypothetical protein
MMMHRNNDGDNIND